MLARVGAVDDRVDDPRRPVDDVEGRSEPELDYLLLRNVERILVGHPARVDAVHVDAESS